MIFVNFVKYCTIQEILSCQYFLHFTIFTIFQILHNIVHFVLYSTRLPPEMGPGASASTAIRNLRQSES